MTIFARGSVSCGVQVIFEVEGFSFLVMRTKDLLVKMWCIVIKESVVEGRN